MTTLLKEMEPILNSLNKNYSNIIIGGDTNINLLQMDFKEKYSDFF